jgi:hypothetical protein
MPQVLPYNAQTGNSTDTTASADIITRTGSTLVATGRFYAIAESDVGPASISDGTNTWQISTVPVNGTPPSAAAIYGGGTLCSWIAYCEHAEQISSVTVTTPGSVYFNEITVAEWPAGYTAGSGATAASVTSVEVVSPSVTAAMGTVIIGAVEAYGTVDTPEYAVTLPGQDLNYCYQVVSEAGAYVLDWGIEAQYAACVLVLSPPAGINLIPIDGGNSYYADNGFSYATSTALTGMSWDDPRFIPILDDYSFYPDNSTTTFFELGLNGTIRVTDGTSLAPLNAAGIWAILDSDGVDMGTETTGIHDEEPSDYPDVVSFVQGLESILPGRFIQCSFTWDQFVYGLSGAPLDGSMQAVMQYPITVTQGTVYPNILTADIYWFAGSQLTGDSSPGYEGGLIYNTGYDLSADQCARGCRYGDMVDRMRGWLATYPAPIGAYIETDDALLGDGSVAITPPQLNWAVWSAIVHGARLIPYFGTTSDDDNTATFGFSTTIQDGQTVSNFTQAAATNALVTELAPVINAPFAEGYFTVDPPPVVVSANLDDSGIDACAKYYTAIHGVKLPAGYWVIATTRESESATDISATFTAADGHNGKVTVWGENRTLTAVDGVFTDEFATGAGVHIYVIENRTSTWSLPLFAGV